MTHVKETGRLERERERVADRLGEKKHFSTIYRTNRFPMFPRSCGRKKIKNPDFFKSGSWVSIESTSNRNRCKGVLVVRRSQFGVGLFAGGPPAAGGRAPGKEEILDPDPDLQRKGKEKRNSGRGAAWAALDPGCEPGSPAYTYGAGFLART